jgi:CubicO group peptidase (beta-lactamase class C family)
MNFQLRHMKTAITFRVANIGLASFMLASASAQTLLSTARSRFGLSVHLWADMKNWISRYTIATVASACMLLALGILAPTGAAFAQTIPLSNLRKAADSTLLATRLPRWWPTTKPSPAVVELHERAPSEGEQAIIDKAEAMLASGELRAFAMLDGDKVVHTGFSGKASRYSMLAGFSMGKTITSMATGKAICAGKLTLTSKAGDVIPEMAGTDLGEATVHDLLRMSSGARMYNNYPSLLQTEADVVAWVRGEVNLFELLTNSNFTGAHKSFFGNKRKPGEAFQYKGTDPMTLGAMIRNTTGMTFGQWMQKQIIDPMGAADAGNFMEDKFGNGMTSGGSRFTLDDWMRFGLWVKKSSKEPGCFGDYVRTAMTKQINNDPRGQRTAGHYYDSYGYLMWTENIIAPNTVWALGKGGQLIGWNLGSDRIILAFSNFDESSKKVYEMAKAWSAVQ